MPLSLREACELSHTLGNPSGCDSKCDSERMLSKLSSKAKTCVEKQDNIWMLLLFSNEL